MFAVRSLGNPSQETLIPSGLYSPLGIFCVLKHDFRKRWANEVIGIGEEDLVCSDSHHICEVIEWASNDGKTRKGTVK